MQFGFVVSLFPCDFRTAESKVSGMITGILFKSVKENLNCDLAASVSKIGSIIASRPNMLEQGFTLSLRSMKRIVAARMGYVVSHPCCYIAN